MLSAIEIGKLVEEGKICIAPMPKVEAGSASLDMRLGRWFATLRYTRISMLTVVRRASVEAAKAEGQIGRHYLRERFLPFGERFILHPGRFVLNTTFEWISLSPDVVGFVDGKSSWARRGISIETASAVHPGFSGCLTLEIANSGAVPVELVAGMRICQLFLDECKDNLVPAATIHGNKRKPTLGDIQVDEIVDSLQGRRTP